jgi:hypothetical protein
MRPRQPPFGKNDEEDEGKGIANWAWQIENFKLKPPFGDPSRVQTASKARIRGPI